MTSMREREKKSLSQKKTAKTLLSFFKKKKPLGFFFCKKNGYYKNYSRVVIHSKPRGFVQKTWDKKRFV